MPNIVLLCKANVELQSIYSPPRIQSYVEELNNKLRCRVTFEDGRLTNSRGEDLLNSETGAVGVLLNVLLMVILAFVIVAIAALIYYVFGSTVNLVLSLIPDIFWEVLFYIAAAICACLIITSHKSLVWIVLTPLLSLLGFSRTLQEYNPTALDWGLNSLFGAICCGLLTLISESFMLGIVSVAFVNLYLFFSLPSQFFPLLFGSLPDDLTAKIGESSLEAVIVTLSLFSLVVPHESLFEPGLAFAAVLPLLLSLLLMSLTQFNLPPSGYWSANIAFVLIALVMGFIGLEFQLAFVTDCCFVIGCLFAVCKWLNFTTDPVQYWTIGMIGISFTVAAVYFIVKSNALLVLPTVLRF